MSVLKTLEDQLRKALKPLVLEVLNESAQHNVPPESESHFRVLIVSEQFEGLSLVKRHQKVHQIVAKEIKAIHAFSQQSLTPEEFKNRGGQIPESPPCAKK